MSTHLKLYEVVGYEVDMITITLLQNVVFYFFIVLGLRVLNSRQLKYIFTILLLLHRRRVDIVTAIIAKLTDLTQGFCTVSSKTS